jgi:hypothetical protein
MDIFFNLLDVRSAVERADIESFNLIKASEIINTMHTPVHNIFFITSFSPVIKILIIITGYDVNVFHTSIIAQRKSHRNGWLVLLPEIFFMAGTYVL